MSSHRRAWALAQKGKIIPWTFTETRREARELSQRIFLRGRTAVVRVELRIVKGAKP